MFHSITPNFNGFYHYTIGKSEGQTMNEEDLDAEIHENSSLSWKELQEANQDSFEPIRQALPNATNIKLLMDPNPNKGDMYIAADDDNGNHATPYLDLDNRYIGTHYDNITSAIPSEELDDDDNLMPLEDIEAHNEATRTLLQNDLEAGTHGAISQIDDNVSFTNKQALKN